MKNTKRVISIVLSLLMVLSVCSTGFTVSAVESANGSVLNEIVLEPTARPKVEFTCTPVTRVAKAVNSAEKGNVIVKATPSGVPELSGPHAAEAYAGEKPVKTEIVFYSPTSGVSITGFSCNNATVSFSDTKFEAPGKYTIYIENGTANVGDALVFTVDYTWTDGNVYQEKCVSYVEDISTGGSFVEHRVTWKPYNGTASWYRGYASAITRVLGKGVYYESPVNVGMSQKFGSYDVSNKAFIESGNLTSYYENERVESAGLFNNPRETIDHTLFVTGTPQAHIYVDKSVTSSLTDINLRINANVGNEVDEHHIRNNDSPNVALGESYIVAGAQTTAPQSYATDANAQAAVGYYVPERKDFGFDSEHGLYHTITAGARNGGHIITTGFTGAVANIVDGSTYTIINRYYAYFRGSYAYITNSPIVPTVMTFHIVDKTVLREAIDYVMNTDPTDPRVRVQEKGVNPQAWYYNSGFIAFQNAYTDALKVLNNPKALQTEINAKASSLKTAYKNLVLKGAEYKEVDRLSEEANAIIKNASCYPASDVALVEEAKDMVVKGYSILYQNAVDAMAKNLEYAISKAVPNKADYSAIDELKSGFDLLDKSIYTTDSVQAVNDAFNKVDYTLTALEQAQVDAWAEEITNAINGLVPVYADLSELNDAIASAEEVEKENYCDDDAMKELDDAVAEGKTIISEKPIANKENIERIAKSADRIKKANNSLVLHEGSEAVIDNKTDSTCTEKGSYDLVVYCKYCDKELSRETLETDVIDHTEGNEVKENEVEATVNKEGSYESVVYCAVCGFELSRVTVTTPKLDHIPATEAEIENEKETTCTEDGSYDEVIYCTCCVEKVELSRTTVTVPTLGHINGEPQEENRVDATCTEKGSYEKVFYCTVCSEKVKTETVEIDVIEHSYNSEVTSPTCTEKGYTTYTCTVCGYTKTGDEVAELGHTPGEWVVTKPAEVGVAGVETLYCTVCEAEIDSKEIPAISAYFKEEENSTTIIDKENGFIYGLEEGLYNLDGFVEYEGGTIEYVETENGFGTGTVVNFIVNGEVSESYTVVIFGDLTGDGVIDTLDSAELAKVANYDIELEEGSAVALAADIAGNDGWIDTLDLAEIYKAANYDIVISQVR